MTEIDFWNLIELARRSVPSVAEIPNWLTNRLKEKTQTEIVDFSRIFRDACRAAYDERLWAAACAISHHFSSEDVFADFRGWLVAQGREVYEKALIDPDSLADLDQFIGEDGENARLERMLYVADNAYNAKMLGKDLGDALERLPPPVLRNRNSWDGNPESLKKFVPRLFAKFRPSTL